MQLHLPSQCELPVLLRVYARWMPGYASTWVNVTVFAIVMSGRSAANVVCAGAESISAVNQIVAPVSVLPICRIRPSSRPLAEADGRGEVGTGRQAQRLPRPGWRRGRVRVDLVQQRGGGGGQVAERPVGQVAYDQVGGGHLDVAVHRGQDRNAVPRASATAYIHGPLDTDRI